MISYLCFILDYNLCISTLILIKIINIVNTIDLVLFTNLMMLVFCNVIINLHLFCLNTIEYN